MYVRLLMIAASLFLLATCSSQEEQGPSYTTEKDFYEAAQRQLKSRQWDVVVDNSGSMNNVVWHPAFRPDVVYDPDNCPFVEDPNDPDYDPRCLEHPLCDITPSDTDLSSGTGNSWLSRSIRRVRQEHGGVPIK